MSLTQSLFYFDDDIFIVNSVYSVYSVYKKTTGLSSAKNNTGIITRFYSLLLTNYL